MAETELEVLKGIADMLSDIRAGISAIEDTTKETLEVLRAGKTSKR